MKYAVQFSYQVTRSGSIRHQFMREEYAPDNLENATHFDTLELAENAADVFAENIKGYAVNVRIRFIPVE